MGLPLWIKKGHITFPSSLFFGFIKEEFLEIYYMIKFFFLSVIHELQNWLFSLKKGATNHEGGGGAKGPIVWPGHKIKIFVYLRLHWYLYFKFCVFNTKGFLF